MAKQKIGLDSAKRGRKLAATSVYCKRLDAVSGLRKNPTLTRGWPYVSRSVEIEYNRLRFDSPLLLQRPSRHGYIFSGVPCPWCVAGGCESPVKIRADHLLWHCPDAYLRQVRRAHLLPSASDLNKWQDRGKGIMHKLSEFQARVIHRKPMECLNFLTAALADLENDEVGRQLRSGDAVPDFGWGLVQDDPFEEVVARDG